MKKCLKCKEQKPMSEFYIDRRASDNRREICKDCFRKDSRERMRKKRAESEFF